MFRIQPRIHSRPFVWFLTAAVLALPLVVWGQTAAQEPEPAVPAGVASPVQENAGPVVQAVPELPDPPGPVVKEPAGPVVKETPATAAPAMASAAVAAVGTSNPAMPPAAAGVGPNGGSYVIGSLDVLYVRVWNQPNLTGMYDVRPDGMTAFPLVGEVKADGLTVAQLTDTLRVRFSEFLNSPEVNVQVTKINSKRFFIIGAVGRAGEYPLVGRTTILEALSSAGGFRDTAKESKIYLLRGAKKFPFDYKKVIDGKSLEQDIPIENGDKIIVPE